MFYEEVFRALNKNKVKYVVAGGVAAVLHGVVRATVDLDIIIELSPKNIEKLFSTLKDLDYLPRVPVTVTQFKSKKMRESWMREKNMKAFSFFHRHDPFKAIDLLLGNVASYHKVKKVKFLAQDISVPVVSVKDLTDQKMKASRPKDLSDVRTLQDLVATRKRKK
mgnify:CR=1 FL=1